MIRMQLLELVQVVALFLELLALQSGKIFDIINIVKGVPIVVDTELIRVERFQQIAILMG